MKTTMNATITFPLLAIATCLVGCQAYPKTEEDFGKSVRHMVRSQTVTTGTVDTEPARTGDGERLNGVLEAYRTDVSRGQESSGQPLVLDLGATMPQQR